ncbi:hypothetical protein ABZ342_24845 [Amycolatopsis sp. NPDC005961]|uniref:hypothetical protein n=1 Tax=Amycolatopsis sp. NPDC005961 TaxID=3156720 RepID=UPI00340A5E33
MVLNYAPFNFDLCLLDLRATFKAGGTAVLVEPERALIGTGRHAVTLTGAPGRRTCNQMVRSSASSWVTARSALRDPGGVVGDRRVDALAVPDCRTRGDLRAKLQVERRRLTPSEGMSDCKHLS